MLPPLQKWGIPPQSSGGAPILEDLGAFCIGSEAKTYESAQKRCGIEPKRCANGAKRCNTGAFNPDPGAKTYAFGAKSFGSYAEKIR